MKKNLFNKILIANRGEIAVRVIRACKELGIPCVAVYSEADRQSLHVKLADESVCIGPANPRQSYLCFTAIISAAEITGADAIHPGYGFLSENADFSEVCQANNITFIGATPENIRLMGNKSQAKKTMRSLGVPIIPGSEGVVTSEKQLRDIAKETKYPLLLKASAGGGGKGMRIVTEEKDLIQAYNSAKNEALSAFGNGDIYVEKLIEKPRHIEIQILSDRKKNAIHLGERECSIQRRHQKLIEESPSPIITERLRNKMGKAAITAAKGIRYEGAGTIEFLVDKKGNFYFMEMNTRIQVEHTVTEAVTGIDLVKEQIRIASTHVLTLKQKDIIMSGHAMEFRVNAEDHKNNFMPAPGKVTLFLPPGGKGVRTDSFIYPGYSIPTHYDSLVAKLIIWGKDREETLQRARRALEEFIIDGEGVKTTIPFHLNVLEHPTFIKGDFDTHFVDQNINDLK
jgi:acetyl-CoA carboxylase biotin carboxylase subunit